MKDGQMFEPPNGAGYFLQESLHDIARAGGSIRGVVGCLEGISSWKPDEDKYSPFDNVNISDLEDAVSLLGKMVVDESNNICKVFGLGIVG